MQLARKEAQRPVKCCHLEAGSEDSATAQPDLLDEPQGL